MANEHIRTAAANLQRAAQDVREQQNECRRGIDTAKRECATRISTLKTQMSAMQRSRNNPNFDTAAIATVSVQNQRLQNEIAQTQKDTDLYVQRLQDQISGLNGQISEFENLASHLNNMA